MNPLLEKLSNIEHNRWSKWMKYLFTKGTKNSDGSFTINADSVKHWKRQIKTNYKNLSEREKEMDRIEARLSLNEVIKSLLNRIK